MTYFNHTADDVLEELGTTEKGLLSSEAAVRLQSYGKNILEEREIFPRSEI
jgi:hypothetical protein